jgi:uncharacterized protein
MPRVTVCHSPAPRQVHEQDLDLAEGATVGDALRACGLELPADGQRAIGVWGRYASAGQVLRERDRIEVYRPLRVDPKVARRERFRKQGSRAAGLFARPKPGPKPGD